MRVLGRNLHSCCMALTVGEAALIPPRRVEPVAVDDCSHVSTLPSQRSCSQIGATIAQYDKSATPSEVKVGDWVFVHFPQDEMGRMRKYHGMGLIAYVLSKGLM